MTSEAEKATIRICNLGRYRLCEAREAKILRLLKLMDTRRLAEDAGLERLVAGIEELIDEELALESPFAGLARAMLADPEAFGARP